MNEKAERLVKAVAMPVCIIVDAVSAASSASVETSPAP